MHRPFPLRRTAPRPGRRDPARAQAALALTLALGLAAGDGPLLGQEVFRTQVELVRLHVSVTSPDGFISNLRPADFRLQIDGEERPVQVAYPVDLRGPLEGLDTPDTTTVARATGDSSPAVVTDRDTPVANRRHVMLFFDFAFMQRGGFTEARAAAESFLEQGGHPSDLYALVVADATGIELRVPFTPNREMVLQAVRELSADDATAAPSLYTGLEESMGQAIAEMNAATGGGSAQAPGSLIDANQFREYKYAVIQYTERLRDLAVGLQALEGRKHLMMFSGGFEDIVLVGQTPGERLAGNSMVVGGLDDPDITTGSQEVRDGLAEAIEALRASDTLIHAVDTHRLRGSNVNDPSRMTSRAGNPGTGADINSPSLNSGVQSLVSLTEDTGGKLYRNTNDLAAPLAEIDADTATYYVIGYQRGDDDPPRVDVRVRLRGEGDRSDGARVVAAPELLAPPPDYASMTPLQRQLQFAEALNDDVERQDIRFASTVAAVPTTVADVNVGAVLQVSAAELATLATGADDPVELEIGIFAYNEAGATVASHRKGLRLGPGSRSDFLYQPGLRLPPGTHRIRIVVRDREVGRISARTHRVWIGPDEATGTTLLKPLFVAGSQPASPDDPSPFALADARLAIDPDPVLEPGATVRLLAGAMGLAAQADGTAELRGVGIEIVDAGGTSHRVTDLAVLGSARRGSSQRVLIEATVPATVTPGPAQFWVRIAYDGGAVAEEQAAAIISPPRI